MAAIAARHARKLVPQAVAFQPRRNYSPSLWQAGRAILNRQFDGVCLDPLSFFVCSMVRDVRDGQIHLVTTSGSAVFCFWFVVSIAAWPATWRAIAGRVTHPLSCLAFLPFQSLLSEMVALAVVVVRPQPFLLISVGLKNERRSTPPATSRLCSTTAMS